MGLNKIPNPDGAPLGPEGIELVGLFALGGTFQNNVVGGDAPGLGNVIAGDFEACLVLAGTDGSIVKNNRLGTDVTGNQIIGCILPLVTLVATGVTIEGNLMAGGERGGLALYTTDHSLVRNNVIVDNPGPGLIVGADSFSNEITANLIGTDESGANRGNLEDGVRIHANPGILQTPDEIGPTHNLVTENVIAFNQGAGVLVGSDLDLTDAFDGTSRHNAIVANSISSNLLLGIDLTAASAPVVGEPIPIAIPDGVTFNDLLDADEGANDFQNFPEINLVKLQGDTLRVHGHLRSLRDASFRLDFYASPAADPSGQGEGAVFLGFTVIETNHGGESVFDFTTVVPEGVVAGDVVTATATRFCLNGADLVLCETSEFSRALAIKQVGN